MTSISSVLHPDALVPDLICIPMPCSFSLYDLDPAPWQEIQDLLEKQLGALNQTHRFIPVRQALHSLLTQAVSTLHRTAFCRIMTPNLGIALEPDAPEVAELLAIELREHSTLNIRNACIAAAWSVEIRFHEATQPWQLDITLPAPEFSPEINPSLLQHCGLSFDIHKIADKVFLRLHLDTAETGLATEHQAPFNTADLLEIAQRLGYGIARFTPDGRLQSCSPALAPALSQASLPEIFFRDVVWELSLQSSGGEFSNYRLRLPTTTSEEGETLFNISGCRLPDGALLTLWQTVSHQGKQLGEGSILNEARVHNITKRYVPQLVERRAREAVRLGKAELPNETKSTAILFCDIVGFTAFAEAQSGDSTTINTLNTILRRIATSVLRHSGAIDKFMGDCVMALFDDSASAVAAAVDIQAHAIDLNNLRNRAGETPLQLRIGVHWGEVLMGNVGTQERLDWTAIGDVVNTASRIEKHCPPGAVLISQVVADQLRNNAPAGYVLGEGFTIQVKGKQEQISVCTVQSRRD